MDDGEDDARYPPKRCSINRAKHSLGTSYLHYSHPVGIRHHENDDFEEDAQSDYGLDEGDGDNDDDIGDNEEDERYDSRHNDNDDDDDDEELQRHPKKRKLKKLMDYELAPRSNSQAAGSSRRISSPSVSFGARNSSNEWTEHETLVLLEAWGDRYLQSGRKSLRSEDWDEVAEKVSEVSKVERTDVQCRNRLDTLKKKYKKEKVKLEGMGGSGSSSWVYFKKLDMLMAASPRQQGGLACGVDSGEYVFTNSKVYLNCANGFDEMRDSPGNSESAEDNDYDDDDDDSEGLPPRRMRGYDDGDGGGDEESSSFTLLSDSIQKFGKLYEKVENSKRQQMMELENMRRDFYRELELQKKQILERAQAEIEKLQECDDDDDDDADDDDEDSDASAEDLSG